jgi:hypothetical protein
MIRFEGQRAGFAFEDPLSTENVNFGWRSFPLLKGKSQTVRVYSLAA